MSWVAVAIAGTAVAGGVYKGVSGNQQKQRNKGVIEGNYQLSKQKLAKQQQNVRQGTTESLIARGLTQGGLTPLARAMAANGGRYPDRPGVVSQNDRVAPGLAPGSAHTLGEQQQVDNDEQFRLEQVDLEQQRERAESENKADYFNTLVNAGLGTVQGVASAAGAHADMGALQTQKASAPTGVTAPDTPASPSLYGAMMGGIDNPANHFGGIVSHDPLNAFGSSWNRNKTVSGEGLTNNDFHV